jgi:hypothetical protein
MNEFRSRQKCQKAETLHISQRRRAWLHLSDAAARFPIRRLTFNHSFRLQANADLTP